MTVHMNVASSADCSGWNRRAAYLCMQPRAWRTPEVYLEKVRAYIRGQGTSHWACFCDVKKKPQWPRSSHGLRPLSPVNVLFECDGQVFFCKPGNRKGDAVVVVRNTCNVVGRIAFGRLF